MTALACTTCHHAPEVHLSGRGPCQAEVGATWGVRGLCDCPAYQGGPVTDSAIRAIVRSALDAHLPASKQYRGMTKRCACGHETPIHDMAARTRHLEDVIVDALAGRG